MNVVNGLFVDTRRATRFDRLYAAFVGEPQDFDDILRRSKTLILVHALASELNRLAIALTRIAKRDRHTLRLHAQQPAPRAGRGRRVLPGLSHLRRRARGRGRRSPSRRLGRGGGPAPQRRSRPQRVRLRRHGAARRAVPADPPTPPRCCASSSASSSSPRRPRPRAWRTRRSTSTPGSRRSTRSAATRARSASRVHAFHGASAGPRAAVAAHDAGDLDARQQAQRGRAHAHRRALGDARRAGGSRCAAGAS